MIWWDNEPGEYENQVTYTDCFLLDLSNPPTWAYLDWCKRTRPDWDLSELSWRVWIGQLDALAEAQPVPPAGGVS